MQVTYAKNGTFQATAKVENGRAVRVVKDRAAYDEQLAVYTNKTKILEQLETLFSS